jgi:hypothetical protein
MSELVVKDERTNKDASTLILTINDDGFMLTRGTGINIIDAEHILKNGLLWLNAYEAQDNEPIGKWYKI